MSFVCWNVHVFINFPIWRFVDSFGFSTFLFIPVPWNWNPVLSSVCYCFESLEAQNRELMPLISVSINENLLIKKRNLKWAESLTVTWTLRIRDNQYSQYNSQLLASILCDCWFLLYAIAGFYFMRLLASIICNCWFLLYAIQEF